MSMDNTAKMTLLTVAVVAAGASVGVVLGIMIGAGSRRSRRRRREEDTAVLAFQIAKLSQQLNLESATPLPAQEVVTESSPKKEEKQEEVQKEEKLEKKKSFIEKAKEAIERATHSEDYRKNDEVDEFNDILGSYRHQYRNWRKSGKIGGSGGSNGTRYTRSLTQTDPNDPPPIFLSGEQSPDSATHLWQQLNLGPTTQKPVKIAVVGGGAFGTSMAAAAGRNGHNVVIYVRRREVARDIKLTGRNDHYLKGLSLPPTVSATTNLEEALAGCELIIHALPAQRSPQWIRENKHIIPENVIYCSTAKGLHLESQSLLSEAMLKAFDRDQPFAVLSGPSFAKEIVTEQPTSVVVASRKLADAVKIQRIMSSTSFRIYASQDVVSVELGGALKNPLALGAGMINGLGFGINTMSAYVTRSCAELTALCVAMGGKEQTVAGLSGVGDLMLTAFGSLSRNRSCGMRLVKGEKLEDILATTTVEGVPTAKVAVIFAERCNLHLPIFTTVAQILDGKLKPEDFVVTAMMTRPLTMEHHTTPLSEVEAGTKIANEH